MDYVKKDLEHIWHPCSQMKDYEAFSPIVIERGEGLYLYDIEGNKYADAVSSWWCNLFGHANPRINKAIKNQLDNLEYVIFANFSNKPVIELCDKLHKVLPQGLTKFFFIDNGLILRPLGDVLYFNPPINITEEDMDYMVEVCKKSVETYFKR